MHKDFGNNKVTISGEIEKEFELSHEIYGETFYTTTISCERLSGVADYVPIMVSERLFDIKDEWTGKCVRIEGQYRSFNKHKKESGKTRLILFVFATKIEITDELEDENEIELDAYICKTPIYRRTPLGREITDVLLAVNRSYGKSDYIPCIVWGRNARFASKFEPGKHIRVYGRIQNRDYVKKFDDGSFEGRVAYEVSISQIEPIGGD